MEKWTKVDLPFQFLKTFGQVVLTDTLTPDDKIEMEKPFRFVKPDDEQQSNFNAECEKIADIVVDDNLDTNNKILTSSRLQSATEKLSLTYYTLKQKQNKGFFQENL